MNRKTVNILAIIFLVSILLGCAKERLSVIKETYGTEKNSIKEWMENLPRKSNTQINGMAIRGLEIKKGETTVFAVSYEPRKYKNTYDCWAISKPYKSLTYTDTEAIYELFKLIGSLTFKKSSRKSSSFQKISELFIAYNSSQTGDKGEVAPDATMFIEFGSISDGNMAVRMNGESSLYETDAEIVSKILNSDPYQYVLKVVSVVDIDSVAKLELAWENNHSCLEIKEGDYYFNGKRIEFEKYNKLYTDAMSIFIADKLQEKVSIDDSKRILTMKYTRNTEEAPDILIKYYKYKNDKLIVSVNETVFFTVNKSDIDELISLWKEE